MKILLDSNILIRWLESGDPMQPVVDRAVERLILSGLIPCCAPQNLGEFWNVLTRPLGRNGYGISSREADRHTRMIEGRIELLPDVPAIYPVWRRLLVEHEVCGVQVHDARLAASMLVHGVGRILTFNARDFARFPVEALHPAQLAEPQSPPARP